MFSRVLKILLKLLLSILGIAVLFSIYFHFAVQIEAPILDLKQLKSSERTKLNDSTFLFKQNFLRKNSYGIWEMYLQGSPEEIGYSQGILSQELMFIQEEAFVKQIKKMIPSEKYLKFLKYVTSFMNRNLPDYIPLEYQKEIKAVSLFADDSFDFIGDNYERQLNYHAAHDIGHAMQNLNLVACTAFSVWDSLSVDSTLLIGRNFDFYVGDKFAENKVLMFISPDSGYNFVSLSWSGMSGVVSGMNNQGLSITLNAAKSEIPFTAKTPVSIIAREIVQYASTIDEAYSIAKKRACFVAETFFIGSSEDGQTAIIEKTPDTTILFRAGTKTEQILTNHFQSPVLFNEKLNQENLRENATGLRFERVEELLNTKTSFDLNDFVSFLRNPYGAENKSIGLGNELALNQFIAHHSILFKPEQKKLWISTKPFQLGAYLPYSLEEIFKNPSMLMDENFGQEVIAPDTLQLSTTYKSFLSYKKLRKKIEFAIEKNSTVNSEVLESFTGVNPNFFYTWELIGDYYVNFGQTDSAYQSYQKALLLEIPNLYERERIERKCTAIAVNEKK
ncbi:MAG: choloylglycine hydrolase [Bacteroidetes bacterium]|nr:MAG: choloylglycine hydrolase [Bacteroidota bacterium]